MQQRSLARSLRTFLSRRPFTPFVIEFVDGERVVVERDDSVR